MVSLFSAKVCFTLGFISWGLRTTTQIPNSRQFYDLQTMYPEHYNISITVRNYPSFGPSLSEYRLHKRGYYAGAFIPPEHHEATLMGFLAQEMSYERSGLTSCYLLRLGVGIKLHRISRKTSEFAERTSSVHAGFRRAVTHLSCDFTAPLDSDIVSLEMEEQQETNVARFSEKLRKFGDGDYLKVGFTASPNWKMDFWGENYVDLLILMMKIRYVPENFFTIYGALLLIIYNT